jgi:hypothetical protein
MKQIFKYDDEGKYIEPILIGEEEELPLNCTDKELPQPNYKPVFKDGDWVETITQKELDELFNNPKPKTDEERLSLIEAALDDLLLGGL